MNSKNKVKVSELPVGTEGKWKGTVVRVIYLGQNDYSVILVDFGDSDVMTCQGKIPYAEKGSAITIKGEIVFSEKYNSNQINVKGASVKTNSDAKSAILFLSNVVYGLGEKKAKKIVELYGNNPDDYILDSAKMGKIAGITPKGYIKIRDSYLDNKHLFPIFKAVHGEITITQATSIYNKYKENAENILKRNPYQLTYDLYGVGFLKADKLALKAGIKSDSDDRLLAGIMYCLKNNENKGGSSYVLLSDLVAMLTELIYNKNQFMYIFYQDVLNTPAIPDELDEWDNLKLPDIIKNHMTKLNNAINQWDSDTKRSKFIKEMKLEQDDIDVLDIFYDKRLELRNHIESIIQDNSYDAGNKNIEDVLNDLRSDKNNIKKIVTESIGNNRLIYIANTYKAECEVASILVHMSMQPSLLKFNDSEINEALIQSEKDGLKKLRIEDAKKPVMQRLCPNKFNFGEDQKDAVRMALKNRVSCITGGPGRGKTTILKEVIKLWKRKDREAEVILLAPTGKAAKRMTESTGIEAYTISRFVRDKGIKIGTKTIVFADEMSMTDIFLLLLLLNKVKNCQFIFVGDKDQLPSVGVGKCLEDIINSNCIPVTYLTTCYRNDGSILNNITLINAGCRLQELAVDTHFKTLWINERDKVFNSVIDTYMNNYERYGVNNIMVLAAMTDSVNKLNNSLQQRINPKTPNKIDVNINGYLIRVGDRVMQTFNNYDIEGIDAKGNIISGVFNGDTGTVTDIKKVIDSDTNIEEYNITVLFDDGKTIIYQKKSEYSNLVLAYAITYHKSQGSEAKMVICMLTTADYILLQRKILYTGVSRGKELVYLIGGAKAFSMAISNFSEKDSVRYTRLKEKMQELKNVYNIA